MVELFLRKASKNRDAGEDGGQRHAHESHRCSCAAAASMSENSDVPSAGAIGEPHNEAVAGSSQQQVSRQLRSRSYFISGKAITSRMLGLSVSSMTRRSTPRPIPPVGGMPYSSAVMKSSSSSTCALPLN